MSKQNKWKQIRPTKGNTLTISDDDYKRLGDMLPDKQSDFIDDLTDLSTFIYYTLVNLMNKADATNDANELRRDIYNAYYAIKQKLPTDVTPDDEDLAGESILGELTPDNTEDLYTEPDDKHEGFEEQAEGLADLLAGLKDGPHDERW